MTAPDADPAAPPLPTIMLSAINGFVRVDDVGFYWIDDRGAPFGHIARFMPHHEISRFQRHIKDDDPLHHRHFSPRRESLVDLNDGRISASHRAVYRTAFLEPQDLAHEIELFLYDKDGPMGAFALLRRASSGDFSAEEKRQVAALPALLEPLLRRERLPAELSLTPREIDVARLLTRGLTNAQIGRSLGLSLSTVKTHLEKIFSKTGSATRAELVSKLRFYAQ